MNLNKNPANPKSNWHVLKIQQLTNNNYMTNYASLVTGLVLLSFSFVSWTQSYTSMASGAWMNTTTVWSTDGGTTPCGCSPGNSPGTVVINIGHAITVVPNLTFTGSTATVGATGSLSGTFDITTTNTTMDIFGPVSVNRYTQNGTSNVSIYLGGSLFASNQVTINGGTLTADQAILTSGGVDISNGATLNLLNGSKWNITSGNLRNEGTINLDPGACMETNGNILNRPTGVINGTGALNSGGNINNQGTIANTISWCSNGAGVGMTTPEDCATATGICNAIILPVTLESFNADINEYNEVELNWVTLSESNSSHFIVSKSIDGNTWRTIATVQSIGNTTEKQQYYALDQVSSGVSYYMLTQVDNDGQQNEFKPIRISTQNSVKWSFYPNPIKSNGKLMIDGIPQGAGYLTLTNTLGIQVDAISFNSMNENIEFQLHDLPSGIYFMTVAVGDVTKTEQIIISE